MSKITATANISPKVHSSKMIADGIYRLSVKSEFIAASAHPGQFVNIKCADGLNALLRRPISICNVDRNAKTFDIVFQIKGEGTSFLAKKQQGDDIDIVGPLGSTFDLSDEYKSIAVIGGGIGVFPLLFLLNESNALKKTAFLGFRNRAAVVLEEEFSKNSKELHIATDDGSKGFKGIITDLFLKELQKNKYDIVYACGPLPMLKNVCSIVNNTIKCQVSLEQRMGCGIGACLVCVCKTNVPLLISGKRAEVKTSSDAKYSRVCKDGPVFWSNEVMLDE